jgi:hypothetical protein
VSVSRAALITCLVAGLGVVGLVSHRTALASSGGMAGGLAIYVSPSGDDRNPGTFLLPLRHLTAAQEAVRRLDRHMAADITVYLESGTYRLLKPLEFGPQDSGSGGHDVIWSGVPGGTAIIGGARRITGWRLSDQSRDIWSARVPIGFRIRQIYVNGMRASMTSGLVPVGLTQTASGYRASSSIMDSWRNPSEIEFVYPHQLGAMAEPICPVASISGSTITMAQPCWDNSTRRGWFGWVACCRITTPAYLENAYELLRDPGQFYLDDVAHQLDYIPRPGQDMHTADVEAPVLQTLISAQGTPEAPVHNLVFTNLQFSYATWMQPSSPDGFSEVQDNYTITGPGAYTREGLCQYAPNHRRGMCPYGAWTKEPASVHSQFDQHLAFVKDEFFHLGGAGLDLGDGSQDVKVVGSVFTDISGNGLEVGSVDMPEAMGASQTDNITVADNHLFGLPVEYHGGVAILVGYTADSMISHNQIDHASPRVDDRGLVIFAEIEA